VISDTIISTFDSTDLANAAGAGFLLIGITALLYSFTGLTPGFALPLSVALAAACIAKAIGYYKGKQSIADLGTLSKDFLGLAIGSVAFGFLMPFLYPLNDYTSAHWPAYLNAIFLVAGLAAIPAAKGFAFLVKLSVRIRQNRR
jgi:hypothetical protein